MQTIYQCLIFIGRCLGLGLGWPYREGKQLFLIVAFVVLIHVGLVLGWSAERHLEVVDEVVRVQLGLARKLAEEVGEEGESQDELSGSAPASRVHGGLGDEREKDQVDSEPDHDSEERFETLQSPLAAEEDPQTSGM